MKHFFFAAIILLWHTDSFAQVCPFIDSKEEVKIYSALFEELDKNCDCDTCTLYYFVQDLKNIPIKTADTQCKFVNFDLDSLENYKSQLKGRILNLYILKDLVFDDRQRKETLFFSVKVLGWYQDLDFYLANRDRLNLGHGIFPYRIAILTYDTLSRKATFYDWFKMD